MNSDNSFRTASGFCQVQNDAIYFTKQLYDFTDLSHPLRKDIFNGILQTCFITILVTNNIVTKGFEPSIFTAFGISFATVLLINLLYNLRYSRQCEIPKESIREIRFACGIPLITNNKVFIKFITEGKEKETKITLPIAFKSKASLTEVKQIFINQNYI